MRTILGLCVISPYIVLFTAGMLITIPIVVRTAADRRTDFYMQNHDVQQMADEVRLADVL